MPLTYRESQRRIMAAKRASEREVDIPEIANPRRRRRCLRDPELFLRTYLPGVFYNPFTDDQARQIQSAAYTMRHGGLRAEAAPRGDGKTSILRYVTLYGLLAGIVRFPCLIGPTQAKADAHREAIKHQIETNALLAADFPEVCAPVRALERSPARARQQTHHGQLLDYRWGTDHLIFPRVPGSPCAGAILMAIGIEGDIRGANVLDQRPDFALVDDPDNRESAESETMTAKHTRTIIADILGLAGPSRSIGTYFLGTIIRPNCIADMLTNPDEYPAWQGVRRRQMIRPPDRRDLWDNYMDLRLEDRSQGDPEARRAHAYYLDHRRDMEAGMVISNPHRYDPSTLPDGSPKELSAVQNYYNLLADRGEDYVRTELDQDPRTDDLPETMGLDALRVASALADSPRGSVPPDAQLLTAGIDVGGRALHWVVVAWAPGMAGTVIDYGVEPVHSPVGQGPIASADNIRATRHAIAAALTDWAEAHEAAGYPDADTGQVRLCDLVAIDANWQPDPVHAVAQRSRRYAAVRGLGQLSPHGRFRPPTDRDRRTRAGDHWYARPNRGAWLYSLDVDHFKWTVQEGFLAPREGPDSLRLFGPDQGAHRIYAQQIIAEELRTETRHGRGTVRTWIQTSRHNHYLDATTYARAAAAIRGMTSIQPRRRARKTTLSQTMAANA
jgi:hypothetical protein